MKILTEILDFLPLAIISHQIVTIAIYINLRREDKGIEPKKRPRFLQFLIDAFFYLMVPGEFIYLVTIGLVDYLRSKRLCDMLVKRDDIISDQKAKIEKMEKHIEDCHAYQKSLYDCAVENADPQKVRFVKCHTFSSFCEWQRIEDLSADEDY